MHHSDFIYLVRIHATKLKAIIVERTNEPIFDE